MRLDYFIAVPFFLLIMWIGGFNGVATFTQYKPLYAPKVDTLDAYRAEPDGAGLLFKQRNTITVKVPTGVKTVREFLQLYDLDRSDIRRSMAQQLGLNINIPDGYNLPIGQVFVFPLTPTDTQ